MTDEHQKALADLRREFDEKIAGLREASKARDPNVLSALRTLLKDAIDWRNGLRDFPQDAVIGFASAYLRPRIILAFGGIAAVLLAAAQVYVAYHQNEISRQQTVIMESQGNLMAEQGRLLKAQTVAAILPELGSEQSMISSKWALLTAFGDLALDVTLPIVQTSDPDWMRKSASGDVDNVWLNSAQIVSRSSAKLSSRDATIAFKRMMDHYAMFSIFWLFSFDTLDTAYIDAEVTIETTGGSALRKDFPARLQPEEYQRRLSSIAQSVYRFLENRPPVEADYSQLNDFDKELLSRQVANVLTVMWSSAPQANEVTGALSTRYKLAEVCSVMAGGPPSWELISVLETVMKQTTKFDPPVKASEIITSVVMTECGATPADTPEWREWQRIAKAVTPLVRRVIPPMRESRVNQ